MKLFDLLDKNLSDKNLSNQQTIDNAESIIIKQEAPIKETKTPKSKVEEQPKRIGLSYRSAQAILQKEGKNELTHKKKVSSMKIFLGQYKDIMTLILLACTVVSILMGEYIEAIEIGRAHV